MNAPNWMTKVFSHFTIALVGLSLSTSSYAADSCAACSKTTGNIQSLISDATCKNDTGCVACVLKAVNDGQSGSYCDANTLTSEANKGQTVFAVANVAATVLCGYACYASNNGADQACGYAGFGLTVAEIGYTAIIEKKFSAANALPLVTTGAGLYKQVAASQAGKASVGAASKASTAATKETAKKNILKAACINALTFGIASVAKIKSISKAKKSAQSSCDAASALATTNVNSQVATCLNSKTNQPYVAGGGGPGMITTTPDNFVPSISTLGQFASTGEIDTQLKNMQNQLQTASDQGKFNAADIAKKIDAGESASSILAGANLPSPILEAIREEEAKMNAGETSKLLAALGGYSGGAAGSALNNGGGSELGFGSEATPGGSAEAIEIAGKTGDEASAGFGDDDIFHKSFSGSIFDIVSTRIKRAKGTYAELEPEGRMNRVFNGYSDPKRSPASHSK